MVAIARVEEMTGTVGFEFEFNVGVKFDWKPDWFIKVGWLDKFRDSLFGRRAVSLGLSRTKVSDLSPLNDLKNLHYLDLSGIDVSDLIPLTGL